MNYHRIPLYIIMLAHGLSWISAVEEVNPLDEERASKNPPLTLPYASGSFKPTWESLSRYQVPEWFRDAKFGIWAHWGPQCQPEAGDWYARNMYIQGKEQYEIHQKLYGHPSVFGFKDVINLWKADKFEPQRLVNLYKQAGAKYFVGMAVHHDNFDLWNSKHQPWNAVNMGPKQDLVGKWAEAARAAGLRFGVSIHARSAWTWYEVTRLSDKTGPKAGIPYDGNLTKADGKGLWWEGYDPQDLYAQHGHRMSPNPEDRKEQQKNPGDPPSPAFCTKYYNRVLDLMDKYRPDLLYFDDYKLPLYGINQSYGLSIAAGMYNDSMARNGGRNEAVINTKILDDDERRCLVKDLEVGVERDIQPIPWQVDACIGHWHYLKGAGYKRAEHVVRALIDVVSKNGNLLLNIPVRGEGTIDEKEVKILEGIGAWMSVNGEAIYGTRPWQVFGEGPSLKDVTPDIAKGGQPLFRKEPYVAEDLRFTTKGGALYAIAMAWPTSGRLTITSLAHEAPGVKGDIAAVTLLGCPDPLTFTRTDSGLEITLPTTKPCDIAYAFKITGLETVAAKSENHGKSITVAPPTIVSVQPSKLSKVTYQYKTLTVANLTDFHPKPIALSPYGGRKDLTSSKATGFFRTEKLDGRWHLIDPTGARFINVGINSVKAATPPENPTAFTAKFGERKNWATRTKADLDPVAANSLGCWSDPVAFKEAGINIPYTPQWNFISRYGYSRKLPKTANYAKGFLNECLPVFDPAFEAFCEQEAKALEATKDDPWIIGHFSDNELPLKKAGIIQRYLDLPPTDPGHLAVKQWMKEKGKTIADIKDRDDSAFCTKVISRYFEIVSAAIKRHDPNHLFLGSRFHGRALGQDEIFLASGPYVDVVSVNYYHRWTPNQDELNRWATLARKPILITEWYAKGDDAGLNDTEGAGFSVATQAERGMFYENFTLGLLRNPNCVGWHWFRWTDDVSKIPGNKGIYSGTYQPYEPLIKSMATVNRSVYQLQDHLRDARSPNLLDSPVTVGKKAPKNLAQDD